MKRRAPWLVLTSSLLPILLSGCGGGGDSSGGGGGIGPGPSINPIIAQWPAGTTWTYQLTSPSGSGTRTRSVTAPGKTNPSNGASVLELKDSIAANGATSVANDFYFRQDSAGNVILEGLAPGSTGGTDLFITSSTPSPVVIFPSPMSVGQQIGPTAVTFSNGNKQSTLQTSVDDVEVLKPPIGASGALVSVPCFRLTTVDTTNHVLEQTWFSPQIGIVQIQTTTSSQVTTSLLTSTTLPH